MTNYERIKNMNVEEMANYFDIITNEEREDWNPIMCAHCIYHGTHHEREYCKDCEFGNGLVAWLNSESDNLTNY